MISRELRYKAVIHYKHFLPSLRKVSRLYGVSKSSLQRWLRDDPACFRRLAFRRIHACVDLEALVNSKAVAVRYSRHAGTWEAKKTRVHKVLQCKKRGFPSLRHNMEPDVNASLNILRLGVLDVFDIERPSAFCHKASPKQLTLRGKAAPRLCGVTRRVVVTLLSSVPLAAPTSAQGIQSARDLLGCGTNPTCRPRASLGQRSGVPHSNDL